MLLSGSLLELKYLRINCTLVTIDSIRSLVFLNFNNKTYTFTTNVYGFQISSIGPPCLYFMCGGTHCRKLCVLHFVPKQNIVKRIGQFFIISVGDIQGLQVNGYYSFRQPPQPSSDSCCQISIPPDGQIYQIYVIHQAEISKCTQDLCSFSSKEDI